MTTNRPRLRILAGAALVASLLVAARALSAQSPARLPSADQSTPELQRLVAGLTITPRVLIVGMHPDDEPSNLIAWLSRGRHIETGYLSITRGEAGQGFGGTEAGSLLGAVRVEEALAARRLDGAKLFYTRAYDFGPARDAAEALKHWNRDSIVGDIVAVIRAFRPQILIAITPDSAIDGDGQHQALSLFAADAYLFATDTRRFPPRFFGDPWPVTKFYKPGPGLNIETAEFDRVLGKTYAELALETRAQQRSEGLKALTQPAPTTFSLRRLKSAVGDSTTIDRSLFTGIDTSLLRLVRGASPNVANALTLIAAYADSAQRVFDPSRPAAAIPYLARVAGLATSARGEAPFCKHPSASAAPPVTTLDQCTARALDLDASIDLVRDRAVAAFLAASGISFEATADRDVLASRDTASVAVTIHNRGTAPLTVTDVAIWGNVVTEPMSPLVVAADSTTRVSARVAGLAEAAAWWIGPRGGEKRGGDRFDSVLSAIDGLSRSGMIPQQLWTSSATVPENIRRASDVNVTLTVSGTTVSTDLGPVIYRYADPVVGLQNRALGGIPDVTLGFNRGLDWLPRNKPLDRVIRVAVKSHSDRPQNVGLSAIYPKGIPKGVHVDSLQTTMFLDGHEQHELLIKLRGRMLDTARLPFGLQAAPMFDLPAGAKPSAGTHGSFQIGHSEAYQTGLRTVQRAYLPPIRMLPSSGEWLQPIDIEVPANLTTLYISGVSDDNVTPLKQVGVWVTEITSSDQLLTADLSKVSTIAFGPRAFELQPDLLGQIDRLHEFLRKGGTLVIMRAEAPTLASKLFPFSVAMAPVPERVGQFDAPVVALNPAARVLTWPNKIGDADWADWVGPRAFKLPSVVSDRWTPVVEMHDPEQRPNRNAILIGRVGKGTIIYTSITFEQQIAGGVPGALRLLVNLLSAGLTPAK